jgi:hypothetical protein
MMKSRNVLSKNAHHKFRGMRPSWETDRLMSGLNLICNRKSPVLRLKNCALLGNYAATSANYLSKFWGTLSVPSLDVWRWDWRFVPKRRHLSTNLHSVTTQKSEHLIYTVAAARNHTCHVWLVLQATIRHYGFWQCSWRLVVWSMWKWPWCLVEWEEEEADRRSCREKHLTCYLHGARSFELSENFCPCLLDLIEVRLEIR